MDMKSNQTFAILSAIAIIMVVDAHCGGALNLFTNFFPYNSFFMPLFVFVSGYFFSTKDKPLTFIYKKTKRILLPYIIINLIYIFGILILQHLNPTYRLYSNVFSLVNFIKMMFTSGAECILTTPAWFVVTLYFTTIIYYFIKLIFKKWNNLLQVILTV